LVVLDLSKVNTGADLNAAFSNAFGFPFNGKLHWDALTDHLRNVAPEDKTINLGVFGQGGLKKRSPHTARLFLKIIDQHNDELLCNRNCVRFKCRVLPYLPME
jgi:hypothetical protein